VTGTAKPEVAELSEVEQRLVDAARSGQLLDLASGDSVEVEQAGQWGPERVIRAGVVRDLLLGRQHDLDPRGVRLRGARLDHNLDLDDVRTATPLQLIDCHIDRITARRAHLSHLDLTGAHTSALQADNLHLDHDLNLTRLHATSTDPDGAIRLRGAHISGTLYCAGARLTSSDGPALDADRLQVDGGVYLNDGFQANGASPKGVVRLLGGHISGQLDFGGARLTSSDGPALHADGIQVDDGMFLSDGFQANGAGGVVRLLGAHIGGQLACVGARLTSSDAPALHADGIQVDGAVFLSGGFQANGAGPLGVIRLVGAHISGPLVCVNGRARHDGGGLDLDLHNARVGQVDLDRDFARRVDARDLRYNGIPIGPTITDWLGWLCDPDLGYAAQPYQHLAAAHRAAGHHNQARRILIAQQHDLAHRGGLTGWLTLRHRILWLTLGYGYQSWRALAALTATITIAVTLAITAGAQGIATHTKDTTTPGAHCSLVEQIGLGVDLGAPLINTGTKTRCALTTDHNTAGSILTATSWLLQLLGFAFATLFIAGFTGIIRKD
jgi:hypothetical protein